MKVVITVLSVICAWTLILMVCGISASCLSTEKTKNLVVTISKEMTVIIACAKERVKIDEFSLSRFGKTIIECISFRIFELGLGKIYSVDEVKFIVKEFLEYLEKGGRSQLEYVDVEAILREFNTYINSKIIK